MEQLFINSDPANCYREITNKRNLRWYKSIWYIYLQVRASKQ